MRHLPRITAGAAGLALLLTACGADDFDGGGEATDNGAAGAEGADVDAADAVEPGTDSLDGATITVGSKDFDEQLVLGEISKLLLENAGASVVDEIDLGSTFAAREALTGGQIDHYWEYTGTAWIEFYSETDPIPDRVEQYEAVRDLEVGEGLYWLEPSPFNNTYGLAMSREAYDEFGIETLSDIGAFLESNPDDATLCVESEFEARSDGLPGMEAHYDYAFDASNVHVLDTGVIYGATADRDPCTFGEIFTTDGRIATLDLHVIEDDQSFFPLYNVSPVFTEAVYEQYGQTLIDLYGPVAEALDDETMAGLNARVSSDNERPLDVAQDWLTENGFIG